MLDARKINVHLFTNFNEPTTNVYIANAIEFSRSCLCKHTKGNAPSRNNFAKQNFKQKSKADKKNDHTLTKPQHIYSLLVHKGSVVFF